MQKLRLGLIGLGYIGLPTAALLANRGYDVHGVDVVQSTVDIINQGKIHIVEPELDTFVHAAVNSGKLKADLKPTEADVFIIAVPTPFHEGYVPNVDYVVSATKAIAPYVKEDDIIILESTSPVGTTDMVEDILKKEGVDTSKIYIAHCPERVLPGHIMRELVENDRIVGGTTPEATNATVEFYKTFVEGEVLATDAKTAEMAKLTENMSTWAMTYMQTICIRLPPECRAKRPTPMRKQAPATVGRISHSIFSKARNIDLQSPINDIVMTPIATM